MPTKAQHSRSYKAVSKLLRRMREDAGLTQRAIGERLSKPQSWVYNSETGNRRVDLAEFCDWCKACGVSPVAGVKKFVES